MNELNFYSFVELNGCVLLQDYSDGIGKQPGLCHEIIHVQLMFWTLVLSVVYSYACKQYRKRFIVCFFLFLPLCKFFGHILCCICCSTHATKIDFKNQQNNFVILTFFGGQKAQ